MAEQRAVEYIKELQNKGFLDPLIREELIKAGWPNSVIDEAFEAAIPQSSREEFLPKLSKHSEPLAPAISEGASHSGQRFSVGPRVLLLIAGAIITIAALAAGGLWYVKVLYPTTLRTKALANLRTIQSYRYDAELRITARDTSREMNMLITQFMPQLAGLIFQVIPAQIEEDEKTIETVSFLVRASGGVDQTDLEHKKYLFNLTFDMGPVYGGKIGFESLFVDSAYYFRFTEIPELVMHYLSGEITGLGEWIRFDSKELGSISKEEVLKFNKLSGTEFEDYYAGTEELSQQETERARGARQRLTESSFIVWQDDVFSEKFEGKILYRFKGKIDRDRLEHFVRELLQITEGNQNAFSEEEFLHGLELLGDIEINIWVDRGKEQVVRMSGFTTIFDSTIPARGVVELLFTMNLSDINKLLEVAAPTETISTEEFFESLAVSLAASLADSEIRKRDIRRIADLEMLADTLELYHDQRGRYPKALDELAPEFIVRMPKDPQTDSLYIYRVRSVNGYLLSTKLEDPKSSALNSDADPGDQYYDIVP